MAETFLCIAGCGRRVYSPHQQHQCRCLQGCPRNCLQGTQGSVQTNIEASLTTSPFSHLWQFLCLHVSGHPALQLQHDLCRRCYSASALLLQTAKRDQASQSVVHLQPCAAAVVFLSYGLTDANLRCPHALDDWLAASRAGCLRPSDCPCPREHLAHKPHEVSHDNLQWVPGTENFLHACRRTTLAAHVDGLCTMNAPRR